MGRLNAFGGARLTTARRAIFGAALSLALGWTSEASAQRAPVTNSYEVVVGVGKAQVLELPSPYSDLMIAEPKVADVLPLTNRSLYVVGKGLGSTALTIYGPGKRLLAAVNVVVSADIESFKSRLHEVLPSEGGIEARAANQSIILSGTATSPAVLQRAVALAETYAPGKVVNMVGVEGAQQVMLSVRFVEMERTVAKNLRVNVDRQDVSGDKQFTLTSGDTLINSAGSLLDSFGLTQLILHGGDGDLTFLIDALETKGLVKTLAEPNLVAMSGDTASFLAGGEFPIPVAQDSGTAGGIRSITIEFKQFGVALAFTPTILSDGMINLVVNPEVSAIDPSVSVTTGGIRVPGVKVRRARTTVELRDGESFTIAGLLRDDYENQIRQLPFVGDIPILGSLFRSTGYRRNQTELVIVVTPHLVTARRGRAAMPSDRFIPPSDFELFLFGAQRGSASNVKAEDRVLMSLDPTKGGVEGPYGHVVY